MSSCAITGRVTGARALVLPATVCSLQSAWAAPHRQRPALVPQPARRHDGAVQHLPEGVGASHPADVAVERGWLLAHQAHAVGVHPRAAQRALQRPAGLVRLGLADAPVGGGRSRQESVRALPSSTAAGIHSECGGLWSWSCCTRSSTAATDPSNSTEACPPEGPWLPSLLVRVCLVAVPVGQAMALLLVLRRRPRC
jgi:hypothetical protein